GSRPVTSLPSSRSPAMRSIPTSLAILVLVSSMSLVPAQEPPPLEFVLQTGHTGSIWSLAQSENGKFVVTAADDGTAILWDAATGKRLRAFDGHTAGVYGVAISRDGKHVVTASEDRTAILWEAATGKKLRIFQGHTAEVKGVALSRDGKHVVTGSLDGTAIVW